MIARKQYLDRLIGFKDKDVIKIVTGIRRCGKSTLLKMFETYLLESGVRAEQIIAINFEDFAFESLRDPKTLHEYILNRLLPGEMNYIFLDEIQNVPEFPRVTDSLYIKENTDLYLTGSNSYMLSDEIATLIAGRYILIEMLPLSLREFADSFGDVGDRDKTYERYLLESSFPGALQYGGNAEQIAEYLQGIYHTILIKDITARKKISDPMMLESVMRFVFDNIGKPLSCKRISDSMTSASRKINVKTVESYVSALMESYVIYEARRYDIKGKQYLKTLEKYYVADIGLRYAVLGSKSLDIGRILENIVYLELLRRSREVYVGKADDTEVDFVAVTAGSTQYFQVAATVRDASALERELRPLQKIADHYPKCILTLDRDPVADYDGILRMNAVDFLMGDSRAGAARERGSGVKYTALGPLPPTMVREQESQYSAPEHAQTKSAVNLAEFAAMLTRALCIPESFLRESAPTAFADTDGYAWAVPYFSFLYSKGILTPDEKGNVYPGKRLAMKEAVRMALRAGGHAQSGDDDWKSGLIDREEELKLYADYAKDAPLDAAGAARVLCAFIAPAPD